MHYFFIQLGDFFYNCCMIYLEYLLIDNLVPPIYLTGVIKKENPSEIYKKLKIKFIYTEHYLLTLKKLSNRFSE